MKTYKIVDVLLKFKVKKILKLEIGRPVDSRCK